MRALIKKIRQLLKDRRFRKIWYRGISATAAVVVFITTYALVLPAITMETEAKCGIPAHQHTTECYEEQLICGQEESDGHRHTDDCYKVTQELTCEIPEHTHDESCFDENGNLTCRQDEHSHGGTCYEEHRELTCGLEESEGHHHDSSCYKQVLTCGLEAHIHSPECYKEDSKAVTASTSTPASEDSGTAVAATAASTSVPVKIDDPEDSSDTSESYSASSDTFSDTSDISPDAADTSDKFDITDINNMDDTTEADSSEDMTDNENAEQTSTFDEASPESPVSDSDDSIAESENSSTAATIGVLPEPIEQEKLSEGYVPTLDSVNMEQVLDRQTGFYYYHAEEGEDLPASSAEITSWKKVEDDTELAPADLVKAYFAYTIPAGTINETNQVARYRLPSNLHLTDEQILAINQTVNGVAAAYVDQDTLQVNDTDNYYKYLGAESVEGTRTPDETLVEGTQEYISAIVKTENVYENTLDENGNYIDAEGNIVEGPGEHLGQDLIFIFTPYTIEKNQITYDKDGNPVTAGEKVRGWFTCDFNIDQIDWKEDNTSEIVFVKENQESNISEINSVLRQADLEDAETEDSAADGTTEEAGEFTTEKAATAATIAETAKENSTEDAAALTTTAKTTAENRTETDKNKKDEVVAANYPAVVFDDSITVRSGHLDTDLADTDLPKKTKMTVHVEADTGTFPEGTKMVLSAVEDLDAVAEAVGTAVDAKTRGFQAVDITFYDKDPAEEDAKEIEPLKPIRVSIKSDEIKKAAEDATTAPVVVHIEDDNTATEIENMASKTDSAAIEIEKPGVEAEMAVPENGSKNNANEEKEADDDAQVNDEKAGDSSTKDHNADKERGETDSSDSNKDNVNAGLENEESQTDNTDADSTKASSVDSTDAQEVHPDNNIEADEEDKADADIIETRDAQAENTDPAADNSADGVTGMNDDTTDDAVHFEADSFSIYAVVYTVDFHWEVNGKSYTIIMPGGGFMSFRALMEALGTAKKDEQDKSAEEVQAPVVYNLNDIPVSQETKEFVADVESVVFSSPELVWVGKAETDISVGTLKEENKLKAQYSAGLTEEQIAQINAQMVEAGDWALISLKPFTSNETLTVTMKNGDQFVVNVTDAQDPSVFLGKDIIIYDNTEKQAMTSNYATDYRTHFNTVDEITADSNERARWKIEQTNGGYYLRSNDGKYLYLDHSNVRLVNNAWEATVLTIQAGGDPNYRIYAANNNQNALRYCDNNQYPGFFSAVDGTNGAGNSREWLYIREATAPVEPLGDWLLYFDDDFSGKEITIRVGETITLRPYNKWEWKEGNVDVQTDHWNVGTWNDWSISSSDGNGSKLTKTTDGPFEFTRYVKHDDQLNTHYWSVQGRATQTGTYTLTNTKNNKTITVHVVDEPVDHPKTINKIANIKVNLFDYDKYGTLDGSWNNSTQWWNDDNHANDSGYKNVSVNGMGGSDHFYFLSSGGGNQWGESWNDYTHDAPKTLIVKNELGSDGYPVLNHGNNTSLKYLFDSTKTSWNGGSNSNDPDGMICYPDVIGMFQKDPVTGYYYFNSNTNYYYYDTDTGTSYLYEHTYTQASSQEKNSLVNDKPIGFFPFHEYDSTDNLSVNQNHNLNHHIGMSMEVEFMLPRDRKDDKNQPIIFDFSGDDDLWVFVEWEDENGDKHSRLLLDLGGVHQPIHGDINFTNGQNTKFMDSNRPYTLKVFYLERGGCDSNCSIKFNLPIIQDLNVAKKLTGLTEAEKKKYSGEEFWYELVIDRKPYGQPVPYTYPNPDNRYEKAVIRNAAGEDVTPEGFTITNGRFKLKDGETLTISYLDRTDKFTVAELKTDNMENFEVPNAERFYHQEHDASLYEEEITLTASHTKDNRYEDWVTPEYELEDTEKVTFTNTLKEKNLEVEKKWIGNQEHPESITFTVSATVDDGQGGRTPYAVAELKNTNGTDKVFTLNDDNDWRHEIEHLPVNTPDGKFIFYDIQEGHTEGYALTGIKDLTAENYNYCNIDVVKLWPDSNGNHTEVLQVVLKNSEGKYYAGVDNDGKATFVDVIEDAQIRELKPGNNYSQRYDRLPYGDYTAEQLDEDIYNHGLAAYKRAIIQYDLENTPLVNPVDPEEETVTPVIHKRIDALRDGIENPDSAHTGEDLTDLYRLYLDYKIDSLQDPNGVDLLFVIDHSGSMNDSHWPGNEYRAPAVMAALNGENGIIAKFLAANDKNRWAAVGFKGPDGFRDYEFALSNPWQPKENDDLSNNNAGLNGSEVLSSGGTSYEFTRNAASIELDNEGPLIQSNYTAGFWRAEQFLLKQEVKNDRRKKVVIFIADGVPTLHIGEPEADSLNGSLQNAGTAAGSNYYREEYGGCPDKALAEFGYFVSDLTGNGNGYVFGGDNGNIDFYAIGLGALMQTEDSSDPDDPMSGSELLNRMLSAAYGQTVPANHYMTITDAITDPDSDDYSAVTNTLSKDLRIILGLNDTFSNLVIQDDLSKYVDLYGLTAGSSASAIMNAAKAKVTMTVPDLEHPEDPPQVITLYENGALVDDDAAKFTKADGTTKATIINRLEYVADSKTVKAVFDSEYHPAYDVTYTLSFDVKATNDAYTTYAATGYDKYTSGEHQGQTIVGDEDTDFLGTTPANATSVDKPGFRSNDEAKATYVHNDKDEEEKYPHPVIQVAAKADIVKIDQTGAALEGAKFNLYDNNYDPSKTIEENADHLIESDLQSKKPTDPAGNEAVIRNGKLIAGTYYLVETHAPDGFNSLPGPVKITVTETNGVLYMTAEIAGVPIGGYMLQKISNGVWKLQIQNSAGYELPNAGGPGTRLFTILGSILILGAGVLLWRRRRLI